ncbi:hypothetical protein [Rodentibacter trehalosifermentans]|uniref:hypothetical protein n=1 Tax=Rodentibacter trehalosifermentans TaxID=1908263 RepID=UPI0009866204|nr:hypothetical protein [Rodentibacter trehalosifermentans]OOF52321.1 hypothetical protein BKK53_06020 [Rodentibacter trehalosifermentans]
MDLLKINIIGIVSSIIILICVSILRKTNPNLTKLQELKEFGGHTYQSIINIAISVFVISIASSLIGIISYLFNVELI